MPFHNEPILPAPFREREIARPIEAVRPPFARAAALPYYAEMIRLANHCP